MASSTLLVALFLCCSLSLTQAFGLSRWFCRGQPTFTCNFRELGGSGLKGRVLFRPVWRRRRCQTLITAKIQGMEPRAVQAMHVHEGNDLSTTDGSGLLGHFTHPFGFYTTHGLPQDKNHDWGDLGNLRANGKGVAIYRRIDSTIWFTSALAGRGMIIHASRDKGRPFAAQNGAAGARRAQCVIMLA